MGRKSVKYFTIYINIYIYIYSDFYQDFFCGGVGENYDTVICHNCHFLLEMTVCLRILRIIRICGEINLYSFHGIEKMLYLCRQIASTGDDTNESRTNE